jgi:predicted RNA-binding Zn-ribbon protein involved in translation (DUF1610 family)
MKSIKMLLMAALSITTFSLIAQDTTRIKVNKPKMEEHAAFSCPMHPGEMSDKPGKCAKCGMALKESHTVYTCPMHSDVKSDKPGKCPKCGMALNMVAKEKMKMETIKTYACPMHTDVTSKKPGKCSKCGMDLKVKN